MEEKLAESEIHSENLDLKDSIQQKDPQQIKKIKCKKIYSIAFGQQSLIITCKYGLIIYSLTTLKPIFTMEGKIWQAVFIPKSNYIAYVIHESHKNTQNIINFYDYDKECLVGSVQIKYKIQYIRASFKCLAIASLQEISIIRFPQMKPIYYGLAGNCVKIVFDISNYGLVLAHDCQKKGVIIVNNFTTPLNLRKQTSISKITQKLKSSPNALNKEDSQKIIQIQAYHSQISHIKVSPYGGRVAVASNNDYTIKIFITTTGQICEIYSINYNNVKILDFQFNETGEKLACILSNSITNLYNCKLDHYDTNYYIKINEKSKSQVNLSQDTLTLYHERNPKPLLQFLSFFYKPFSYDLPFAYHHFVPPENLLIKSQILLSKSQTNIYNHEVHSVDIPLHQQKIIKKKSEKQKYVPSIYNTISKVYFGNHCTIWAIKGYYLYAGKYDQFHGGTMHHIKTLVIE